MQIEISLATKFMVIINNTFYALASQNIKVHLKLKNQKIRDLFVRIRANIGIG